MAQTRRFDVRERERVCESACKREGERERGRNWHPFKRERERECV